MKKLLFLFFAFFITSVSVKEVKIYFHDKEATSVTNNFDVSGEFVTLNEYYYATYNDTDIIKAINSINNNKFTLIRSGAQLAPKKEWFAYDANNKYYYFDETQSYSVSTLLEMLGKESDSEPMIDMYANWQSEQEAVIKNVNKVYIRYNLNGGKIVQKSSSIYTQKKDTLLCNKSKNCHEINYDSVLNNQGLLNYNNPKALNVKKTGYRIESGREWYILNKKGKIEKCFSQNRPYLAKQLCDASQKSCVVTLYLNWVKKKKPKLKSLGTINLDNAEVFVVASDPKISVGSNKTIAISNAQGVTVTEDYYVLAKTKKYDEVHYGALLFYNKNSSFSDNTVTQPTYLITQKSTFGHANGIGYDGANLIVAAGSNKSYPVISAENLHNGNLDSQKTNFKFTSVDYDNDSVTNRYYTALGNSIKVCSSLKTSKKCYSFKKAIIGDSNQDLGAYKGYILSARWNSVGYDKETTKPGEAKNAIDIYKANEKTTKEVYVGSIIVIGNGNEIEGIAYDKASKKFIISMQSVLIDGHKRDVIYRVNESEISTKLYSNH